MLEVRAHGRINLIGDHTDYTGGWVLPMVIDEHTTIRGEFVDEPHWSLVSDDEPESVELPLPIEDPSRVQPRWGRYVAGVLGEIAHIGRSVRGFVGRVSTSVPIGSGLSSSAALEVAVARVALRDAGVTDVDLARLCQRAEQVASGVPCGIMDQLCIASGRPNEATLIDCTDLTIRHCPLPESVRVTYEFVAPRQLSGSEYATRVDEAQRATAILGPLREANLADVQSLPDPILRRRARHIVTENRRVLDFAEAMRDHDAATMGALMIESHRSMQYDYETSNDVMDAAVERLLAEPDVLGARLTGGGFGGCVIALRRVDY
jgi:galactokinase